MPCGLTTCLAWARGLPKRGNLARAWGSLRGKLQAHFQWASKHGKLLWRKTAYALRGPRPHQTAGFGEDPRDRERPQRFEVMGTRSNSQIPSQLRAQCVRSRDAKSVLPIGGDHAAVSPGRPVTRPLCTSIVAVAALYASDKQPVEC